ncbi:MAG: polysaccharide deacetylase family protein [Patescibacteria group bacterium]|nr:polysaccharide deacetylase family protein [Patescibacteria group bacterium]MDD5554447.1 polysaccharide deacetylase family protein [Patescibacteria group bacterium]
MEQKKNNHRLGHHYNVAGGTSKIILSFDFEHWYDSYFLRKYLDKSTIINQPDLIKESLSPILDLLKAKGISATFFITGKVAEKYPEIVKKIALDHEVAAHSYSHEVLYDREFEEYFEDIKRNKGILENIIGKKIFGFRAPCFSLNKQTLYLVKILEELGFKYDSSLVPAKVGPHGVNKASRLPFRLSRDNFFDDLGGKIIEFPLTTFCRMPISGGFYFRFIPYFIYKRLVRRQLIKENYFVFYGHPHEFFNFIPDVKAPRWKLKLKYWGIKNSFKKLEKFINDFEFINFQAYLHDKS